MHEVMELIRQGLARRHQSATKMHEHSSRSHLIVIVTLTTRLTKGNLSASKDTDCIPKEEMTNGKREILFVVIDKDDFDWL